MHYRDDVVLRKGMREPGAVLEIAGHQRAGNKTAVAGGKIVVDHRMIPAPKRRAAEVRADIARAARHQHCRTIVHVSLVGGLSVADGRLLLNSRYSARGLVVRGGRNSRRGSSQ